MSDEGAARRATRGPSPWRGRLIGVSILLLFLGLFSMGTALDWWAATRGESVQVTGVVPVRQGDQLYFVVSGHSERTSENSNASGRRYTSTSVFPRLTTWRASDGGQVAMRQYSPVISRFEYVDTVVRALLAADGRVWVVSTEEAVGLHAVDALTLSDVLDKRALGARIPELAQGVFIQSGSMDTPVGVQGRELSFRLSTGPYMLLDPVALTARRLAGASAGSDLEFELPGREQGHPAVEALVRQQDDLLEPDVAPVYDAQGEPDGAVAYVFSQTSLDRERAAVRVTRWATEGPTPTAGWTTTLDDLHPECCQLRAFRDGGHVVIWYEHWLIALDDATGARLWTRRI